MLQLVAVVVGAAVVDAAVVGGTVVGGTVVGAAVVVALAHVVVGTADAADGAMGTQMAARGHPVVGPWDDAIAFGQWQRLKSTNGRRELDERTIQEGAEKT